MVVKDRTTAALLEKEQRLKTMLQLRTAKKLALVGEAPRVLYFISV